MNLPLENYSTVLTIDMDESPFCEACRRIVPEIPILNDTMSAMRGWSGYRRASQMHLKQREVAIELGFFLS